MIRKTESELWSAPVWVDFMAQDEKGRVPLDYPGTQRDLDAHAIKLQEGMQLTLYTLDATEIADPDDLVCVGTVEWDQDQERWFAAFNWRALVHVSELDEVDRNLYRQERSD